MPYITLQEHSSSLPVFWWGSLFLIFLAFCIVLLCVFTFGVPCCDAHCNFHIKMMFGSSLPQVVCRRVHVLLTMFGSSLPQVVRRRAHVLLMMFGSSLPQVVCRRAHVLLMMFGSSLPQVACRRAHILFTLFLFAYV